MDADLQTVKRIAPEHITSLWGPGQTARNCVMTASRCFRDAREAHLDEKRCPVFNCTGPICFESDTDERVDCDTRVEPCSTGTMSGARKKVQRIGQQKSIRRGIRPVFCPPGTAALMKGSPLKVAAVENGSPVKAAVS